MVDEYTAGMWIDTNIDNSFRNQLQELAEFCRGSGTLGCFALNSEGKPVLLSCQHVLFPNDLAPDKAATFQPRYSCCCGGAPVPSGERMPRAITSQSATATSGRRKRTEERRIATVDSFVAAVAKSWRITFWMASRPTVIEPSCRA